MDITKFYPEDSELSNAFIQFRHFFKELIQQQMSVQSAVNKIKDPYNTQKNVNRLMCKDPSLVLFRMRKRSFTITDFDALLRDEYTEGFYALIEETYGVFGQQQMSNIILDVDTPKGPVYLRVRDIVSAYHYMQDIRNQNEKQPTSLH